MNPFFAQQQGPDPDPPWWAVALARAREMALETSRRIADGSLVASKSLWENRGEILPWVAEEFSPAENVRRLTQAPSRVQTLLSVDPEERDIADELMFGLLPGVDQALASRDVQAGATSGRPFLTAMGLFGMGLPGSVTGARRLLKEAGEMGSDAGRGVARRAAREVDTPRVLFPFEGRELDLFHYGPGAQADVIDPRFHGRGIKGEEGKRRGVEEYLDRSYYYVGEHRREGGLSGAPARVRLPEDRLGSVADLQRAVNDVRAETPGLFGARAMAAGEARLVDEGLLGYRGPQGAGRNPNDVAVVFGERYTTPLTDRTIRRGFVEDVVSSTRANGGATFDPVTGRARTEGFVVAAHPDRWASVPADIGEEALGDAVEEYTQRNWDLLAREEYDFGSWYNEAEGRVEFDVVRRHSSKEQALEAMRQNNEAAAFDLSTFEEITNPDFDRARRRAEFEPAPRTAQRQLPPAPRDPVHGPNAPSIVVRTPRPSGRALDLDRLGEGIGFGTHSRPGSEIGPPLSESPFWSPGQRLPSTLTTPVTKQLRQKYGIRGGLLGEENIRHLDGYVERGLRKGSNLWYDFSPWADEFVEELGPELGEQRFNLWSQHFSALSPRTRVEPNIGRASESFRRQVQGIRPSEPFLIGTSKAKSRTIAQFSPHPQDWPPGFGHMASRTAHAGSLEELMSGRWDFNTMGDPATRPKTSRFQRGTFGDLRDVVADAHYDKILTGRGVSSSGRDYSVLEEIGKEQAERYGLMPGAYQSTLWGGADEVTGVADSRVPVEIMDEMIVKAAQARGISFKEMIRRLVRGEDNLFAG